MQSSLEPESLGRMPNPHPKRFLINRRNTVNTVISLAIFAIVVIGIWLAWGRTPQNQSASLSDASTAKQPVLAKPAHSVEDRPASGRSTDVSALSLSVPSPAVVARPIPAILEPTNLLYINHRSLTETQKAIRSYRGTVVSNGVPANSAASFEQWANVLYRDAMTQHALDPALSATDRQEWATRMAAGIVITNRGILMTSKLEPAYLERLGALVARLPLLKTQEVSRAIALGVADEFGRLTKDRQWESEVHYLSAYKALKKESSLSVAELITASRPFVVLQDPRLTKSILTYVTEMPKHRQVTRDESLLIERFVATSGEGNQL
jgi:hypothetical protein